MTKILADRLLSDYFELVYSYGYDSNGYLEENDIGGEGLTLT
jgi:hypothetical protein